MESRVILTSKSSEWNIGQRGLSQLSWAVTLCLRLEVPNEMRIVLICWINLFLTNLKSKTHHLKQWNGSTNKLHGFKTSSLQHKYTASWQAVFPQIINIRANPAFKRALTLQLLLVQKPQRKMTARKTGKLDGGKKTRALRMVNATSTIDSPCMSTLIKAVHSGMH